MNVANLAITRPVFIVMIVLSILTLGVIGYSSLPVDLLPNVDFPNLIVIAAYPGTSANQMEISITKPLENALGTVEGLDTLSSNTSEGVSRITVAFKMGTDLKFAELKVREKVQGASSLLPSDLKEPIIRRFSSDDIPIMFLSLRGSQNLADLKETVVNDIQPKLEALDGVGSINVFGGRDKIISITIDRSLLLAGGITYQQVSAAIQRRNITFPVGTLKGTEKNVTARIYGKADTFKDIGEIPISSSTGKVLRIKDVARIDFTVADETTRARVEGQNAVLFAVYKQSGTNTVHVADGVSGALDGIQKNLPSGSILKIVMDTSTSIKRSIKGVQEDILTGAFLAVCIVWLFLGNLRSTLITAIALPNSLLGAFFLVSAAGFSINVITLLSLSLSVGLLIDDSIVVRENIFRHIELGLDPKAAAVKGTNEVALAVLSTTLSIMAVFIPISFLQGVVGQFFRQFGLTVAFALFISLIDAFTSAPMLSAYWYKKTDESPKGLGKVFSFLSQGWNRLYDAVNRGYRSVLHWSLDHKPVVLLVVAAMFITTIPLSRYIGQNFMNDTDNGVFSINISTYPGASLDKIDYFTKDIEGFLAKQQGIDTYFATIGGGTFGAGQSNEAGLNVIMKPFNERKISTAEMVRIVRTYIRGKFDKDISYRLGVQSGFGGGFGGGGSPVQINIYGEDLKVLEDLSQKMTKIAAESPGTSDINSTISPSTPELVVRLDDLKAEQLGINAADLGNNLKVLFTGATISSFTQGKNDYDVIIRLDENQRRKVEDLQNIMVMTRKGKNVPLSAFCTFTYSSAPLEIRRESNQRIVKINGNILPDYSLTTVIANLQGNFAKGLIMPAGYSYAFVGQQKDFVNLVQQMLFAMLIALIFMYMILASLFNSFTQPFILMLSIPLAIIGSFLGLLMTNINLDTYGYIGILLVLGLVAKNAILLIDYTNRKRHEDGLSIREALLTAGPVRLRPILMTTFALIFGMLPLALGLNEGSAGRQALPVAVIGGLLTSTFLTLVVIPIVYETVEGFFERRRLKTAARAE